MSSSHTLGASLVASVNAAERYSARVCPEVDLLEDSEILGFFTLIDFGSQEFEETGPFKFFPGSSSPLHKTGFRCCHGSSTIELS